MSLLLQLPEEKELLREAFDQLLETMPGHGPEISLQLACTLAIRQAAPTPHWVDQFSTLTLLYPLLQAECLDEVPARQKRVTCLAHLCLLIHTFLEDRVDDGQATVTIEERQFGEELYRHAIRLLRTMKTPAVPQPSRMARPPYNLAAHSDCALTYLAIRKAAPGFVASEAMLRYAPRGGHLVPIARRAFDSLALALQYIDDSEDWRQDLTISDDNFLLGRLRDEGLDPYMLPANEYRAANVAHAVLRHGILEDVLDQCLHHIEEARHAYQKLNCSTLSQLMNELQSEVCESRTRLHNSLENEVLVGCLIAGTVSS